MKPYAPDLREYEKLDISALLHRSTELNRIFPDNLGELSARDLNQEFDESLKIGLWSCRITIGHITDADIAFTHRLRRIAGEERPGLEVWEEGEFIANGIYDGAGFRTRDYVNVVKTNRLWLQAWLADLEEKEFQRVGIHPVLGEQSLRHVLNFSIWHAEHHGSFLAKKLEFMGGG